MGNLASDTEVRPTGDGTFAADLSPDWEIWGPNGGYLATFALRAAGAATGRARPASITSHFVGGGSTGPIDIAVEENRATRVATSVTVRIGQEGRPWLVATVWGIDDALEGLSHHTSDRPILPPPDDLQSAHELAGPDSGMRHAFWSNFDSRPLTWIDDWPNREPGEPESRTWYRMLPDETFDDPWVDAGRSLILVDVDSWPAAVRAHTGELDHFAPTIELTARFVTDTTQEPWLLSHATAPVAAHGLIAASSRIWTSSGTLATTGGSTLLCRPATRRPDR